MENFTYRNPTTIVFGKGMIRELSTLLPEHGTVLMTYGGGSIKRNGVYDQVKAACGNRRVVEFGGIQPNPRYETLMEAVLLARKEKVRFLLPVGGGSVLDGTKFIAAAVPYTGADPWDIITTQGEVVREAIPLGCVLTLPATGSESNGYAVISRESTKEKLHFYSDHVYPRFAILDPATTFSLPERQVANGIVDAFCHVMEQYATYPAGALLQDRQAEGILLTLIEAGPVTLRDPRNYDARANLVWCATQALNGLIACGVPQDWGTHMIGHELTALYGIDHAQSLAVVLPATLRHQLQRKKAKLAQYARRVWSVSSAEEGAAAEAAVAKTEEFFRSLGVKTRLSEYGIPEESARLVADRFKQRGTTLGEHGDIGSEEIFEILTLCK